MPMIFFNWYYKGSQSRFRTERFRLEAAHFVLADIDALGLHVAGAIIATQLDCSCKGALYASRAAPHLFERLTQNGGRTIVNYSSTAATCTGCQGKTRFSCSNACWQCGVLSVVMHIHENIFAHTCNTELVDRQVTPFLLACGLDMFPIPLQDEFIETGRPESNHPI